MSILISFGQVHAHHVNGKTFDKDCLARVRDRDEAMELFGTRWSFEYEDNEGERNRLAPYFPRGIIDTKIDPRDFHTFTESDDY